MASGKNLIKNSQAHLEEGEAIQYAFTAESGFSRGLEALGWIPGLDDLTKLLIISNKPRIVVISDKRIMVFSAGRLSRKNPKSMLQTFPRSTRLEHGTGRRSTIKLGDHSLRIERHVYWVLDKANAGNGNTATKD